MALVEISGNIRRRKVMLFFSLLLKAFLHYRRGNNNKLILLPTSLFPTANSNDIFPHSSYNSMQKMSPFYFTFIIISPFNMKLIFLTFSSQYEAYFPLLSLEFPVLMRGLLTFTCGSYFLGVGVPPGPRQKAVVLLALMGPQGDNPGPTRL